MFHGNCQFCLIIPPSSTVQFIIMSVCLNPFHNCGGYPQLHTGSNHKVNGSVYLSYGYKNLLGKEHWIAVDIVKTLLETIPFEVIMY